MVHIFESLKRLTASLIAALFSLFAVKSVKGVLQEGRSKIQIEGSQMWTLHETSYQWFYLLKSGGFVSWSRYTVVTNSIEL